MENKQSEIIIIANHKNRLDILKPVFEILHKNGIGKYTKDRYYCLESNKTINRPDLFNPEQTRLFNTLQTDSYNKGITTSCYCLSIDI
jgi:hypothetical protein